MNITSLAHKTGGMVEHVRSRSRTAERVAEKRREGLKSKITVLGDDGRILGVPEDGQTSGERLEGRASSRLGMRSPPGSRAGDRERVEEEEEEEETWV